MTKQEAKQQAIDERARHLRWACYWPAPHGLDLRQAQAVVTCYAIWLRQK